MSFRHNPRLMHRRDSGRIGVGALFGGAAVCAALIGGVFLFSGSSPSEAAVKFMSALAKGDVQALTGLTALGTDTPAQVEAKWKFATEAAKHYRFGWSITSATTNRAGDRGAVRMQVERNLGGSGSYGENFQLPMVKKDGTWKVEVSGISREMYPFLPRAAGR